MFIQVPSKRCRLKELPELQWQLAHLPHQPGVYLMKNQQGAVLYIGKATVLANRVKSYFQAGKMSPKTDAMVAQIESIETIVTGSELEALLLENNLIKKYRPKYNILLRDDKSYPLLRLPLSDDYPRLSIVRRVKKDGALYFGPYIPSNGLYETLRLLRRLFPLPNCTIKIDGKAERHCIEFEIKRCLAPCTGNQSKEAYHEMVQQVRLFLEGKDSLLMTRLSDEMDKKSDALLFEEAARIRDQIAKVKRALERQRITSADREDQDVLAIFKREEAAIIAILFIRNGMVLGKDQFYFEGLGDRTEAEIVSTFVQQFYDHNRMIPKKVLLPVVLTEQTVLQQWLSAKSENLVRLVAPLRGASKQLIDLAMDNAKSAFETRFQGETEEKAVAIELQELLHLSSLPHRIEGYDISNIMGTAAVGSMVVFEGGVPKKSDYRQFKIKTIDQANDFGMMAEVLSRRVAAVQEKGQNLPDLILIDGGRGQISAVRAVLEEAELGSIDLIGLAKERDDRPERVFLPDLSEPIELPLGSAATHLLMQVRNEAHRFAVTFHRKIRSKNLFASKLQEIAGIGTKRRLALLRHFGSIDKVKAASLLELEQLPGFPKKVALQLFEGLRLH